MSVSDIIKMYRQSGKGEMKKGTKKENGKIKHLDIRLTEKEYQEIAEKASKKNKTKSEFILDLVKKEK